MTANFLELKYNEKIPVKWGSQRYGSLYRPDTAKWNLGDCPLCYEPFSVHKTTKGYFCDKCHRQVRP